jgi:glyoxylase-like metal-dependent hydrolase (beta-lactamase superfamily II)
MPTIHHLDAGTLRPTVGRDLIGADELVSHVIVLELDDRLVLVDAGIGLTDMAAPDVRLGADFVTGSGPVLEPERTVVRQLEQRGLDPAAVTDVLLTHPDLDHAGGLADVPHARVHAHPEAVAAVRDPVEPRDRERVHLAQWEHEVRWAPAPIARQPWYGFDAWTLDGLDDEVAVMIDLPGHATGHVGYAIRTDDGWLLHAGDAFFHRASLTGADVPPGLAIFEETVEQDAAARLDTVARLAALPPEVTVVCSHDPVQLAGQRV